MSKSVISSKLKLFSTNSNKIEDKILFIKANYYFKQSCHYQIDNQIELKLLLPIHKIIYR